MNYFIYYSMLLATCLLTVEAQASVFPPGDVPQSHLRQLSPITEAQFNEVVERITQIYTPVVAQHGATLTMKGRWDSDTVNADATRYPETNWEVNVHGGLARHPDMTIDGLTLAICHELGHHLGGFPVFKRVWGSVEGQADYYSTLSCARELWKDERTVNASFRSQVEPYAKTLCDNAWADESSQDLCYRTTTAGRVLIRMLSSGRYTDFHTPSKDSVGKTYQFHPAPQCRLDTLVAGALCSKVFDINRIPSTEEESSAVSCVNADPFDSGVRPRCWFKETES